MTDFVFANVYSSARTNHDGRSYTDDIISCVVHYGPRKLCGWEEQIHYESMIN